MEPRICTCIDQQACCICFMAVRPNAPRINEGGWLHVYCRRCAPEQEEDKEGNDD